MPRQDLLADGILGMFLGSSSALCNKPGSVSGNPFQVGQVPYGNKAEWQSHVRF